jgi:hypothetical protein
MIMASIDDMAVDQWTEEELNGSKKSSESTDGQPASGHSRSLLKKWLLDQDSAPEDEPQDMVRYFFYQYHQYANILFLSNHLPCLSQYSLRCNLGSSSDPASTEQPPDYAWYWLTLTTMKGKFVTSNYSDPIANANYKCNSLAVGLVDGRYFRALLSMRNYWPAQNFTDCPSGYYLLDRTRIATNLTDLLDVDIDYEINKDKNNTDALGYVWTRTQEDGTPADEFKGAWIGQHETMTFLRDMWVR